MADDTNEHLVPALRGTTAIQAFAIAGLAFSMYSVRMFIPALWDSSFYIPLVSPVYRQQEHWRRDGRAAAVVAHVAFGIVMLCVAAFQLDAPRRRAAPLMHRWLGRLYVAAGIGAILALRVLRPASGAGSAPHGDPLMRGFIDAASLAWIICTARGVLAMAVQRDASTHSRYMLFSTALALVPVLQRVLNFFLVPLAISFRAFVLLVRAGVPPWHARLGKPGSTLSLLAGPTCAPTVHDPRACPALFSADGFGEAEQAVFALSAWTALTLVLAYAAAVGHSSHFAEQQLGLEDTKLRGKPCLAGHSCLPCMQRAWLTAAPSRLVLADRCEYRRVMH